LEGHVGFQALLGAEHSDSFGGLAGGVRAQIPSRLAPFAGLGLQLMIGDRDLPHDGLDNDNDFLVDEADEKREESIHYASVYPELGAHFWISPRVRLTGSVSYHITTTGRDDDQWMLGIGLALLAPPL
jgi:hypothetical protein